MASVDGRVTYSSLSKLDHKDSQPHYDDDFNDNSGWPVPEGNISYPSVIGNFPYTNGLAAFVGRRDLDGKRLSRPCSSFQILNTQQGDTHAAFRFFSLSSIAPTLIGQDGGKRMGINFERVKYWLSVGAQPSDPAQRILFRAGLLPPPPMVAMGRKGGQRDTRPVDPLSGRFTSVKVPANPDQEKDSGSPENGGKDGATTT
uniref:Ribosomal protein S16 n=1 Tax=Cannabis sativa TaxID=3483 RepID=A0A803Q899_CANSA